MDYKNIELYEDVQVQSNLNGYHTKRHRLGEIEHNHRKIGVNEVVWDIDTHDAVLGHEIVKGISDALLKEDKAHSIWHTSRSYHVHAFFDLATYPKEVRKELRLALMLHYAKGYEHWVDKLKASEDVMIRDFGARHEATGKCKVCTFTYEESGLNVIPAMILGKVVRNHLEMEKVPRMALNCPVSDVEGKAMQDFINYCLANRFDQDGGRSTIFFKNIAIAGYLLGMSEGDAIWSKIARNCQGKRKEGITGWFQWCRKQRHRLKVNWREVETWYQQRREV